MPTVVFGVDMDAGRALVPECEHTSLDRAQSSAWTAFWRSVAPIV